ncbi:hypothetical protein BpHYR1_013074 [Brachionus plicatilis]|uniref:Uncharacterized protein n=1 Tax=Brachionus plicatilis TaxID=10195 RepID=A0A3M7R6L4_BRAPC|nr:hypothetical protein BpHYR1_013074 [Brachionus plicatilis]
MGFVLMIYTGKYLVLKPRVYVRPCTKYPTHGIKACVAKQGDTVNMIRHIVVVVVVVVRPRGEITRRDAPQSSRLN